MKPEGVNILAVHISHMQIQTPQVLDQQVKSNGALGQSSEAASALEQKLARRDDHGPICTLYFRRWFLYVALKNRSLFFSDAPWQGYFGPGTPQTVEIGT